MLENINPEIIVFITGLGMLLAKDLTVNFLKRKLDRKEVEVGELLDKYQKMEENDVKMTAAQEKVLAGERLVMQAINNLVQGARLPQVVKDHSNDLMAELSVVLKDVAFENVDGLIQESKDRLMEKARNNQVIQDIPQSTKDKITEAIPESIKHIVSGD